MSLDEAIVQLEKLIGEVRQASLIDDKTPLGSLLALRQEGRLINTGASEFSVVVFGDLNDFKNLNDEFGHEAGDIAIRSVGEALHEEFAKDLEGKAFRQSGDEFVILFKQEYLHGFLSRVPSFGKVHFSHKQEKLSTAMSFGYALSDGKTSFEDLLERAEVACLHAKGQGNGCCIEWTESIKANPLVRLIGKCERCNARITCNVPKHEAPLKLKICPCCGERLDELTES
jgi:diguanylate cyclase (GGDEF)-like protein